MSEAAAFAVESAPARTLPGLRPRRSALWPRRLCLALAILVLCGSAFATLTGPVVAVFIGPVDKVLVDKSAKKLWLLRDGKRLYEIDVSLGKNPKGQKQREGDQRTPEGTYRLDWRDAGTDYHRAILVSYPSQADRARGAAGGEIMIHGQKFFWRWFTRSPRTNGCIGVSNLAMDIIWSATAFGTPIEIRP